MAAALLAPLMLPALGAVPAAAHAIVLESVPAQDAVLAQPPERVMLRFNSKIEKRLTRVTLGPSGGPRQPLPVTGAAAADADPDRIIIPLRPLPPARYVIRYKVLSADGHVTEGALRFTVSGSP
jgi:methionine-rich copper-binding protein CopC